MKSLLKGLWRLALVLPFVFTCTNPVHAVPPDDFTPKSATMPNPNAAAELSTVVYYCPGPTSRQLGSVAFLTTITNADRTVRPPAFSGIFAYNLDNTFPDRTALDRFLSSGENYQIAEIFKEVRRAFQQRSLFPGLNGCKRATTVDWSRMSQYSGSTKPLAFFDNLADELFHALWPMLEAHINQPDKLGLTDKQATAAWGDFRDSINELGWWSEFIDGLKGAFKTLVNKLLPVAQFLELAATFRTVFMSEGPIECSEIAELILDALECIPGWTTVIAALGHRLWDWYCIGCMSGILPKEVCICCTEDPS
jgi:hypothetical protein